MQCISTATTFTTAVCKETFKTQIGPFHFPYVVFPSYRFNNYKSKHRHFRKGNRKVPQKLFRTHYCLDGHSGFVLFEQCETHAQLKERETFWQHRFKPFTP